MTKNLNIYCPFYNFSFTFYIWDIITIITISIISLLSTLTPISLRDDSCNMVSHVNCICLKPCETDVFCEKLTQRDNFFPLLKVEGAMEKSF